MPRPHILILAIWIAIFVFWVLPPFAFAQQDTLILLGTNSEMFRIYAVSAYNRYAFVMDGDWGIRVINYSDPYNPYSVTGYPANWPRDIEIRDSLAYYVGDSLYIRDISNPIESEIVGSCLLYYCNWAFRVHLFDSLALAMYSSSPKISFLDIINISDPANPQRLSTITPPPLSEWTYIDAWKKDNYVYWVDHAWIYYPYIEGGRIIVLDITDPTEPITVVVDTCLPRPPFGIWIKDNYAYVADEYGGLMALDISDPYNIDSVGCFKIPEVAVYNVYIKGNLAYVSGHLSPTVEGDGVYVLDITDATNPTLVSYYHTPGIPMDVFVDEPYVLVAEHTSLLVFEASFLIVGDVNWDREINIADVVYLINYLFINGPHPPNPPLADANSDSQTDIADAVYLLNYLFLDGPPPGC